MRLIITLLLSLGLTQAAFAKAKKAPLAKNSKTKVTRVVSVNKNQAKKKQPAKKQVAKKAPKKMSESERKILAKRQVEQARRIASQQQPQKFQKPEKPPRDFRANNEVIIKDHGFEQTPPTAEETAVMTAAVTSQDLQLDNTNGTTPYIDGTAIYVDRDTSSSVDDYDSVKANDFEVDFED